MFIVSNENYFEKISKLNNCVTIKEENSIALLFSLDILEYCNVDLRLHNCIIIIV